MKDWGGDTSILINRLQRQSEWLGEMYQWLLNTKILPDLRGGGGKKGARQKALDVGCGPGYVMEMFSGDLDVTGIDIDPEMVDLCIERDLSVVRGDAEDLPFNDGEFDLVYCSFLMMWVKDQERVMQEMVRVSRGWVVCLAEPDFGGRIDHPIELKGLKELIVGGILKDGGDPHVGRKLSGLFRKHDLRMELGVHPGVWGPEVLANESDGEWNWLRMTIGSKSDELEHYREHWDNALKDGTLFQFNPVFYALGKK